ncbi:hypothetical protein [Caulobacter vibrioides]|uniref:Killing protein CdzC n=1 Tax=Caulobacter vibrioides (strain NA1000 / CB15N) TaxID=565050 RepID=A0A0H3IXM9_CAUVN|nr:hypothetical protein [Caulobacter vibrioides]YP_009020505.1 killing protein CdzC [Caulobacter vibrioides NA1000]AHI88536.1 killing protein CdzC [Caulobacter vibrioides NA1000]ATC27525.1 bacteriocin, lactobin A family protein [Caulobacter vibrioides]QXZ52764.1 hypothetical protein KZH45_03545 [Caulobacter vibrioides]
MTALAMNVRELSFEEVDEVAGANMRAASVGVGGVAGAGAGWHAGVAVAARGAMWGARVGAIGGVGGAVAGVVLGAAIALIAYDLAE